MLKRTSTTTAHSGLPGFEGRLISPGDVDYDEARAVHNGMIDKRPALLARCANPADVARAIVFAADQQLPLAVRGGGHNGAGLGTCDDGVVIDLSPLRDIRVDPQARTARVGGGTLLADLDRVTHAHGLALPTGIIGSTGVGGITLGGGIGYLTRSCGLSIDNLLSAEIVLATGERVRASAEENAELFWAIRGGGGNFGVVTEFEFRLHPVDTVVAGPTFWPVEMGPEVLSAYRDFLPQAPRELYGFFAYVTVPPADPFPAEIQMRKACGIVWHYRGDADGAAREMAPLLDALPEPLLHGAQPMPHPMMQGAFDGLYPAGDQWYWRADFMREIPDGAIEQHARYGEALPTMKSTMHLYPVDGAAHDVAAGDTAWGYRDATFAAVYAGVDPDPANAGLIRDWCVDYYEAVHPYSAGGAYVNMMMDEGPERVRASYRDNYDRLARIKADYDPDNLFRINQNIPPS
jgi:FAD/FMN-containing dehydrogenase